MIGDQADCYARLKQNLPPWFGREDDSPAFNALVQGAAWVLSFFYSLYLYAKLQTRFATMTGGWLDLGASDYFGEALHRFGGEPDGVYSRRIRLEVLRPRNTRTGIDRAVFDLTGNHPAIYEGWRPADIGCVGATLWVGTVPIGTPTAPNTVYITTPAPRGFGIPNVPGLNDSLTGLESTFALADAADTIANGPTPTDVLNALERVRTAGRTYFVQFT
jgi:hypothetical protein